MLIDESKKHTNNRYTKFCDWAISQFEAIMRQSIYNTVDQFTHSLQEEISRQLKPEAIIATLIHSHKIKGGLLSSENRDTIGH